MNDLSGLDWSSKPATGPKQPNYTSSTFSTLKPTPPVSGRSSPLPPSNSPAPTSNSRIPANDSFSNLVSFSGASANKNVSLQEQQKRLADLKLQQLVGNKEAIKNQWTVSDDVWNNLGSGRSTPAEQTRGTTKQPSATVGQEEDDLFAAFNDPQPNKRVASTTPSKSITQDDEDDPFGLSEFQARSKAMPAKQPTNTLNDDEDDILGDLGRPVKHRPPILREPSPPLPSDHPQDKAVAELVDMGFPPEKARQALETTQSGIDIQAAVGFLLNQAHAESQQKTRSRNSNRSESLEEGERNSRPPRRPQTMGERENAPPANRERSSTPSNDPGKAASDFGTAFMKSANSFWKQAQKQVQAAVQDFNSDSDSSQPKWMRDPDRGTARRGDDDPVTKAGRGRESVAKKQAPDATDEAMMLETERPTPPPRPAARMRPDRMFDSSADNSRDHSPVVPSRLRESSSPQPAFMRSQPQTQSPRTQPQATPPQRAMLNRQAAEEQATQAYVSSARRRKPATTTSADAGDDLLDGASRSQTPAKIASNSNKQPPQPTTRPKPAIPAVVRPAAPARNIPQVSSISLKASHAARLDGNNHFKRGDYASAHQSYGTSLSHLPKGHPLTIVLLTNHALTALKTGEPKLAITDADTAISIIGVSKGESETIDFVNGDPLKPMRDYYGKALMRKAEALEQMEKWTEAALTWKQCVEDGHGGSTAIQGRARAERAAQPKPSRPVAAKKPAVKPKPTAVLSQSTTSTAVTALRAANAAAERADDEKFRLSDSIDARITAWRGGKQDNLRALLASLDTVLWAESNWKKISMADLVLPGKVKVQYMKGIAKVHPDKIPVSATTEQRMIAGAVFSTLNEAWDKFKKENGM